MTLAVQASNLTRTFPGAVGVADLNLEIPRGTVYGLIGRNGAGKTTALRLLMGLLKPDNGEARVLGQELWRAPRQLRSKVSYVSQSEQIPGWMSLRELSRYTGGFYERWNAAFAESLSKSWGVPWTRPAAALSGGEQRKAALIMALAPQPEVLLLDEPAAGLDPLSRRELVNELIGCLNRDVETTVLFSTHIISDLERIAERVGILERGRLILDRPLDELQGCYRRVQVIFPGEQPPPRFSIPGAVRSAIAGPVVTGVTEYFDSEHIEALRRWPGVRVQTFPLGLEEIFLELAQRNQNPAPAAPMGSPAIDTDEEGKIVCL